jgi:triosephosphate isomerase
VDEVAEAHAWILELLEIMGRGSAAGHPPVLYGGSVDPRNAGALAALPDVGGFLVGGASLTAPGFIAVGEALIQAGRKASPVD